MTIAIASDLSGYPLKDAIVSHLSQKGYTLIDLGIENPDHPQPYVAQAPKVAKAIQNGEADRGILVCGTGQGMAIVANKHKGIYACVVDDIFSAERAKIVNNANIITLGGWITAPFLGIQIVDAWLGVEFGQKMEDRKEFLAASFGKVQALEEEVFK